MIPFASIEGNLVFIIVAAVAGVINWLMEKKKKQAGGGPVQPSQRPQQPAAGAGSEEQERLRRFLESLGVQPPGSQQGPQRPTPQVQRQQPAVKPVQQIPRRIAQPIEGRMQPARAAAKPQAKTFRPPKPKIVLEPEEMGRAGRIEDAATSIENISGEFKAMNVRVTMAPVQPIERPAHLATGAAGTTSIVERSGSPIAARLRKLLHNPTDLRAAFVAMEVLGKPRGLQEPVRVPEAGAVSEKV
jgi:hypothetical protein